jgi:hypothetical protein
VSRLIPLVLHPVPPHSCAPISHSTALALSIILMSIQSVRSSFDEDCRGSRNLVSLSRSPLGTEPQNKESSLFRAIETEHVSQLQTGAGKGDILGPHALLVSPENANQEYTADIRLPPASSPGISSTSSAKDGFSAPSCLSTAAIKLSQHSVQPHSPLASAVDSATDALDTLRFERPLVLSGLDFSNQEHFGTSIRDFKAPNCATSPEILAPRMNTKPSPGANASQGKQSEGVINSSRDLPPSYSQLPRLRTGSPAYELTNREYRSNNQAPHESESSAAMVTAPETPMFGRWSDGSDFSFDGMAASTKKGVATADTIGQGTPEDDEISPTSNVPPGLIPNSPLVERRSPEGTPDCRDSDPNATITGRTTDPQTGLGDEDLNNTGLPVETGVGPTSGEANPVLPSHATIPGVPMDITGELPSPGQQTPNQSDVKQNQRKPVRHIQKFYREARTVFLRREILDFIIGRQLGRPTRDNLLAISRGFPVSIVDVTATESDAPQSIPP